MSACLHPHKANAKVVTTKMQFSEGCQKHWYFTVFQIYCQLLCTKIYSTLGFLKKNKIKQHVKTCCLQWQKTQILILRQIGPFQTGRPLYKLPFILYPVHFQSVLFKSRKTLNELQEIFHLTAGINLTVFPLTNNPDTSVSPKFTISLQ